MTIEATVAPCLRRIEAARDELIVLLSDMIAIPTLNPPGNAYGDFCEYLARRLKKHGFAVQFIRAEGSPGDSERYPRINMIARREGGSGGDTVHFNGHHDVVIPGDGWTRDPFAATVEGDLIFGRGACDMKGGLATAVIAAESFLAEFPHFAGAIEISATADEESGGFGGVAWLAHHGAFAHVQHVIIPEPLHKDRICLGHRGGWWAEIETLGEIAHGSMPFLGDCAVRHMAAVLARFEAELFPALAQRTTAMPVVPDRARRSTMNVNAIHGGQPEPEGRDPPHEAEMPTHCVPDRCRILIDRRYPIEENHDTVVGEVREILEDLKATRPRFEYRMREINHVAPSLTARDAPVVVATARAIRAVLGRQPQYVVSPGTYDQKHVDRIGQLKNCIAYGPGQLDMAHKADEFISIRDMLDSAGVMAHVLCQLAPPRI